MSTLFSNEKYQFWLIQYITCITTTLQSYHSCMSFNKSLECVTVVSSYSQEFPVYICFSHSRERTLVKLWFTLYDIGRDWLLFKSSPLDVKMHFRESTQLFSFKSVIGRTSRGPRMHHWHPSSNRGLARTKTYWGGRPSCECPESQDAPLAPLPESNLCIVLKLLMARYKQQGNQFKVETRYGSCVHSIPPVTRIALYSCVVHA
jgi:hypothetical protein